MHLKWWWLDRRVYEYFAVNIGPLLGWRDPILIYQMGKAGSSSLRNSLFRCRDPRTKLVLMSHEFFPIRHRDIQQLEFDNEYRDAVLAEIAHDEETHRKASSLGRMGRKFREKFYTEKIYKNYVEPGRRAKVITLIREPIAGNISMFFQLLDRYTGKQTDSHQLDTDELIQIFLERYLHARPLSWFDVEFRSTLGIDVYNHPFPHERGYDSFCAGPLDVLVIKSEISDDVKTRVISKFLDVDQFQLVSSNRGADKNYAEAYARFRRSIRIPPRLLDFMYESKFARHFYSSDERRALRARWGNH